MKYAGCLLLCTIIALTACGRGGQGTAELYDIGPYDTVAYIDETPVAYAELEMFFTEARQYAMAFSDTADLTDTLIERALELVKPYKITQRELKSKGGTEDISFEAFTDEWNAENARRHRAIENGEVIYGPEQYTRRMYYDYLHSQNYVTLSEKFSPEPDEDALRRLYDENDDMFNLFGQRTMRYLLLDGGRYDIAAANALVEDLKKHVDNGETFEEAATALGEESYERVFTARDMASSGVTEFPDVVKALRELQPGQFSGLIDNGGEGYILFHCVSREGEGRRSFEDCREELRLIYMEQYFDKTMREMEASATITIEKNLKPAVENWLEGLEK